MIVEKTNFVDCHMGVIVSRSRMRIDDFRAKLRLVPSVGDRRDSLACGEFYESGLRLDESAGALVSEFAAAEFSSHRWVTDGILSPAASSTKAACGWRMRWRAGSRIRRGGILVPSVGDRRDSNPQFLQIK